MSGVPIGQNSPWSDLGAMSALVLSEELVNELDVVSTPHLLNGDKSASTTYYILVNIITHLLWRKKSCMRLRVLIGYLKHLWKHFTSLFTRMAATGGGVWRLLLLIQPQQLFSMMLKA